MVLLTHALDRKDATDRVGKPNPENFLVLRRIVPALHCRQVRKLEDDDLFQLRSTFDQLRRSAAGKKAATILRCFPSIFHLSGARKLTAAISLRMAVCCCCKRRSAKLGVCRRLAEAMPDRRDPDRVRHAIFEMAMARGSAIARDSTTTTMRTRFSVQRIQLSEQFVVCSVDDLR